MQKLRASIGTAQEAADRNSDSDAPVADALQRLVRYNEEQRARSLPLDEPAPAPVREAPPTSGAPRRRNRGFRLSGRVVKTLLAIALAAALAWVPVERLLSTTSAEATINARLVNLRAPIDGKVEVMAPSLAIGTTVEPKQPLLRLTNARADRQQLDELRRTLRDLKAQTETDGSRLASLSKMHDELAGQAQAFQDGRVRQLEARHDKLAADVKAAEAEHEDAQKSVNRSKDLNDRGVQTIATLMHAERDLKVAEQKVDAARKQLEGNSIELEGARKGFFVGDSYNDVPRSAQRLQEVEQQIVMLKSQLDQDHARLEFLAEDLASEQKLFDSHYSAEVDATVQGRIWEVLTANGEEARSGQDLLRILDCSAAVVTATVSESTYNKIWIGQPVQFRLRGAGTNYPGAVAALTGLTPASSNLAIQQSALAREPYHVTISVPELAARKDCSIGRTGMVTFDTDAGAQALQENVPMRSWRETASDAWKSTTVFARKAGKATADFAQKAGKTTAEFAQKAGKITADLAKKAGNATADLAERAGKAAAGLAQKAKQAIQGSKPATDAP